MQGLPHQSCLFCAGSVVAFIWQCLFWASASVPTTYKEGECEVGRPGQCTRGSHCERRLVSSLVHGPKPFQRVSLVLLLRVVVFPGIPRVASLECRSGLPGTKTYSLKASPKTHRLSFLMWCALAIQLFQISASANLAEVFFGGCPCFAHGVFETPLLAVGASGCVLFPADNQSRHWLRPTLKLRALPY